MKIHHKPRACQFLRDVGDSSSKIFMKTYFVTNYRDSSLGLPFLWSPVCPLTRTSEIPVIHHFIEDSLDTD